MEGRRGGNQPRVDEVFRNLTANNAKEKADLAVGMAFYANGIPFNVIRDPHFRHMVNTIREMPSYRLPQYNMLRTTLLEKVYKLPAKVFKKWVNKVDNVVYLQAKDHVEKKLVQVQDAAIINQSGCTLLSDGLTNVQSTALINYLMTTPRGVKFLKAVDVSGDYKDAHFVASLHTEVLEEVGFEHAHMTFDIDNECKNIKI